MEHLITLKLCMSEIISNIGWVFSIAVLLGAIAMIIVDYFNGKIK